MERRIEPEWPLAALTVVMIGTIAIGSGRVPATVTMVVGLISVIIGGFALARSTKRNRRNAGSNVSKLALGVGAIAMITGAFLTATAGGGFGTGNGLLGAIVAIALGLIGTSLGTTALAVSRRPHEDLREV